MSAWRFIASKLSFRGRLATAAVALSFLVVALAVSVSAGYRKAIRAGVRDLAGDLQVAGYTSEFDMDSSSVCLSAVTRGRLLAIPGVDSLRDVVCRAGIVKEGETVHGVLVKGVDRGAAPWLTGAKGDEGLRSQSSLRPLPQSAASSARADNLHLAGPSRRESLTGPPEISDLRGVFPGVDTPSSPLAPVAAAAAALPSLSVAIPSRLSAILGIGVGDPLVTYFIGADGKVKVRKFSVAAVYRGILEMEDQLIVYADIADMRRLFRWDATQSSAVEVLLGKGCDPVHDGARVKSAMEAVLLGSDDPDESFHRVLTSVETYPNLFSWLDLLDINVTVLLLLMGVVAGFNMISGLLIMLLRNIPTIGVLKTLGMRNGPLAAAFLRCAARTMLRGLLIGNVLAILFCLVQDSTHVLTLNPDHYFVSYVPVDFDWGYLLAANAMAFFIALVMVALPLLMIARIHPAETVRGNLR